MKLTPTIKVAIMLALTAGIIRLVAFYGGFATAKTGQYVIYMHMLFILVSIFFGVKTTNKNNGPTTAGSDLKLAIKAGGTYALLTTIFVYVYFKFIDINYFALKQQDLIDAQVKNQGGDVAQLKEKVESFFSLMNYTTVTLLGLMLVTFAYAVVFVFLNRYMLNRFK